MRLSQGQLSLLAYCPRRYQHAVLDSLAVPPAPAQLAAQQWGDRFHLLMQQRELGLPIAPVLDYDTELQACLAALKGAAPDLFSTTAEIFRQSEHERSLIFNGYWFTVIYDLLRQWGDRAEIVDWKTYLQPRTLNFLAKDWQTRLYLYVLVETTDYSPEQVGMTFWFVRTQNSDTSALAPQQVRIAYSEAKHRQTQQDLQRLTDLLTNLLSAGEPFPQVPPESDKCNPCPFAVRCQRGEFSPTGRVELPDWEAIAEVAI